MMEKNIESINKMSKEEQIDKIVDYYRSDFGAVKLLNKTLKELSELSVECWKCQSFFNWSYSDLVSINVVLRTNLTVKLASAKLVIDELTNLLKLDSVIRINIQQKIHEQLLEIEQEEKIKGKNI